MIKPTTEMAFGQPVWDIHACEICGALILPSTAQLHENFHSSNSEQSTGPKTKDLKCKVCDLVLTLELDLDGAMILDPYDDHMETHE